MTEENIAKGGFIVFEGIDGSGKSTQATLLCKRLEALGVPFDKTHEPTDGEIGLLLRSFLSGKLKTDERAIAALFAADRLDHITKSGGISDTLNKGVNVISDRYYLSSYAYQSSKMPASWVMELNAPCASLQKPDCHVFIDIPPEIAVERIYSRSHNVVTEIFETLERLSEVRKTYFDIINSLEKTESIIIVDGSLTPDALSDYIWDKISDKLI